LQSVAPLLKLTEGFEDLGIKGGAGARSAASATKDLNSKTEKEIENNVDLLAQLKERVKLRETEVALLRQEAAIKGIQAAQGEQANISTEGKGPSITLPPPQTVEKWSAVGQSIAYVQENLESIAEIGIGGAIDSVFAAIQNGDNVFKALGNSVKGFVIELVKAVAKAVILSAIMNALFPGSQAVAGLAGGAGGGITGKILGGLFGSKAAGGPVVAGGGYIVGENGPEKFYPSQPGMIVPNGGGGGGNLTARISGNSLLFLLNQASQSSRMNFG
jgi:hypothetical protein